MSEKTKAQIAEELINEFSKKFFDHTGVIPVVTYSLWAYDLHKLITLPEIETVVNNTFIKYYPEAYPPEGIRSKSRKSLTSLHRQIFFKIARETTYCYAVIGRHLGYDHATVLHANKHITNLLETKDPQVCKTYYLIQNEIKDKFGVNGIIQSDNSPGTDSQPVLLTV